MMHFLLIVCSVLSIHAKPVANNFVELNIPDDWSCAPYLGEQWTCMPMDPSRSKEALVVMSFSEQTPGDSMQIFYNYLNNSLTITDPITKRTERSVPQNMQYKEIQGQTWVDSLHLSYAVPNYFTRYLATIKDGRSVLISITVDKSKYNLYMSTLYKMVESIRLRISAPAATTDTGLSGLLGQKIKEVVKDKKRVIAPIIEQKENKLGKILVATFISIVVFVLIYRFLKRKMKKARDKKGGYFK